MRCEFGGCKRASARASARWREGACASKIAMPTRNLNDDFRAIRRATASKASAKCQSRACARRQAIDGADRRDICCAVSEKCCGDDDEQRGGGGDKVEMTALRNCNFVSSETSNTIELATLDALVDAPSTSRQIDELSVVSSMSQCRAPSFAQTPPRYGAPLRRGYSQYVPTPRMQPYDHQAAVQRQQSAIYSHEPQSPHAPPSSSTAYAFCLSSSSPSTSANDELTRIIDDLIDTEVSRPKIISDAACQRRPPIDIIARIDARANDDGGRTSEDDASSQAALFCFLHMQRRGNDCAEECVRFCAQLISRLLPLLLLLAAARAIKRSKSPTHTREHAHVCSRK